MPNFQRWSHFPGGVAYRETVPAFAQDFEADARQMVYQGHSVTGRPPSQKPMPANPYELNIQDFQCNIDWRYTYPSIPGRRITAVGKALYPGSKTGFSWVNADSRIADAWERCFNNALDRFNDTYRGNLDIAIDLAESKQTLKMLRVADQVIDYTRTFTKRFGPIRAASNLWLMYTYGVKPLLSTIHGLADESVRVVINKVNKYKGRSSEFLDPGPVNMNLFNGWHTNLSTRGTGKASVTIGGYVCSPEVDPGRLASLNPVSLAWELMPYSFVVDWFYNLGGYLRGMETAMIYDSQWRGGYVTKLWAYDGFLSHRVSSTGGYSEFTLSYQGRLRNTTILRSPLTHFPRPTLPSFRASLGSSRLISASALLGQMLGRR